MVRGVTFKCNLPHIDTPKTNAAIRSIPMPVALRQYLHPQANHLFVIGGDEQPITEQTMKRMWERIKRTINVYGATPHVFRHTYMTFADRENVPLKTLQSIGGYADIYTLKNRYTHTQQEDIEHARQRIENMFSPAFCDSNVTTAEVVKPL
ncbi:MAG: tyrosine-type recombinase/integrase [Clostridia bacterium]|nr:tyrosine-type recombinase/integrase [Clostridia bacterium]